MPRKGQKTTSKPKQQEMPAEFKRQLRPGMPASDSVREEVDFSAPEGTRYKILKTTEADEYNKSKTQAKKRKRPTR